MLRVKVIKAPDCPSIQNRSTQQLRTETGLDAVHRLFLEHRRDCKRAILEVEFERDGNVYHTEKYVCTADGCDLAPDPEREPDDDDIEAIIE